LKLFDPTDHIPAGDPHPVNEGEIEQCTVLPAPQSLGLRVAIVPNQISDQKHVRTKLQIE
jgi:hypothetical protein